MSIIMGTITGARMAHLAEAEPMKMFTMQDTITRPMISGSPVKFMAFSPAAPLMASTSPSLDQPK